MSPHRRRDDRARVARAVGTRILACAIALALVAAPARAATSVRFLAVWDVIAKIAQAAQ